MAAGTALTFGAVSGFTGNVTVSGGTLKMAPTANAGDGSDLINDAALLTFGADTLTGLGAAGGTLMYSDLPGGVVESVGAITISAGAGTVSLVPVAGGGLTLSFGALGAVPAGTGLNFVTPAGTSAILSAAADGFVNAHVYSNGANFALVTGTLVMAPVYGVDAGFATSGAALTNAAHNEVTGSFATGSVLSNSLKISGGHTLTISAGETLTINTGVNTAGGILVDSGSATIGGAGAITTAGSGDVVIRVNGLADSLTLDAAIASTTTGGLTKNGAGLLILNGAQSYTGATTINEGVVILGAGARLGGAAASNNNALTIRQDGLLDLGGNSIGVGAFSGAGALTNTGAAATLTVGNNNGAGVFGGTISGALGITKTGTGTISLAGVNSHTGATTLAGGVLAANSLANIGQPSSIGAGDAGSDAANAASLVFNGGTLQYTGSNANFQQATRTPSVAIDRLFTLAGNGTIDSSGQFGNVVRTGGAQDNAALVFSHTGDVVFAGGGARTLTLQGNSTGDNMMRVRLTDDAGATNTLAVTKAGTGLWILNPAGASDYSGATTISAGQLQAVDGAGLSANSNLVLNGGVFQTAGLFSRTLGSGAGQVQWTGNGGFAASTAPLTVNLDGGATLAFGTAPFTSGTLILNSATALFDVTVQNPLDLGTAARTIQVDDNGTTGLDFATISGAIGSTDSNGALTKTGGGVLYLTGASTYQGATNLNAGAIAVTSIGAAGAGATNLGTNVGGGVLNIGSTTTAGYLLYYGAGENVERQINLAGTTGGATIDSGGSGALVINNLANTGTGAKTLTLRGNNSDPNELKADLADSGGTLSVTKTDGGLWILSGTNTFTGALTLASGQLGVSSNASLGAGPLVFSNGSLFAIGGPLSITNAVQLAANTTVNQVTGDHSITIDNNVTGLSGNPWTFHNALTGATALTINGDFINAQTGTTARTLTMTGTGALTEWNGTIQNSASGAPTTLAISVAGTFRIAGALPNTHTGGTTLTQGTLAVAKAQPFGASGTFSFNGGTLAPEIALVGGSDLIANPTILNGVIATITGTNPVEFGGTFTNNAGNRLLANNMIPGSLLTLSGTVNLSNDTTARTLTLLGGGDTFITGVIANGSTSNSSLTYAGTGTLLLTAANTFTNTLTLQSGATTLNGAGTLASAIAVNAGAVLNIDHNGSTLPRTAAGKNLTLAGGTLNFIGDGAGSTVVEPAGFVLGSGGSSLTMSGAGSNSLTFATFTGNAGGTLNLGFAGLGTTNKLLLTTAPTLTPATTGILSRVTTNGTDFAAYDAVNGVVPFAGYAASVNTGVATDTIKLTGSESLTELSAIRNALALSGTGVVASGAPGAALTLTSGGVLSEGGANTLSIPVVAMGATEGVFHVNAGGSLGVSGAITGTGGLTKALGGELSLDAKQYYTGTTTVNSGELTLNAGLNTIFQNAALAVNTGGTLDLNGGVQWVNTLSSGAGGVPGAGGTITSGAGTGTLITLMGGSATYAGTITGAVNFVRSSGSTLTLESPLAHTGATLLTGGTTTLRDDATLLGTSSIEIRYGTLLLDNNAGFQTGIADRVGDAIPITMRGGTLAFTGRVQTAAAETFGAISSAEGANTITASASISGITSSANVTLASLARAAGTTVNFTSGQVLGSQGNHARIFLGSQPTLTPSGLIGGWAFVNANDFAAYHPLFGVGAVSGPGFESYDSTFGSGKITQVFSGANSTTTLGDAVTTTAALKIGGAATVNIAFSTGANVLNLEDGGLLRSNNANAASIGTTAVRGVLTAGGSEAAGTRDLVIYSTGTGTTNFTGGTRTLGSNVITMTSTAGLSEGMTITNAGLPAGTFVTAVLDGTSVQVSQAATSTAAGQTFVGGTSNFIINAVVANNGSGNTVSLVKSGAGILNLSAPNTYTGGTVVNQGTLNLIGSGVVIPAGGLTINGGVTGAGAVVTMNTNAGQIDASNTATLNGRATLTFTGNNTLAGLVFNNKGGEAAPTVTPSGVLTLTNATPITVASSNVANTATIGAGTLDFGAGVKTIDVGAIAPLGQTASILTPSLNITSVITGAGASIVKTGDGVLQLSGQSLFAGGINVTAGGLLIGASSQPVAGTGVSTGPLGTGTLTVGSGAWIVATGTQTVSNAAAFGGAATFHNLSNANANLTINGAVTLPAAAVVNVEHPLLTVSLGTLANAGSITSITKNGPGSLAFGFEGYAGPVTVNGGGAIGLLADGDGTGFPQTIDIANAITINTFPAFIVGRAGTSSPLTQPANKIIRPTMLTGSFSDGTSVTNNNGYGLLLENAVTLGSDAVFTVANATASNVTQGLALTGQISGAGFTKTGAGTLVLGNAANDFTGTVKIAQGVLSAGSDAHLGNTANMIVLGPTTGTSTLRATGSFTTSRTVQLANTTNTRAIEVILGSTLQLDTAFDLNAGAGAAAGLVKADRGTLKLNAGNAGWSGSVTISGGALNTGVAASLGTGAITVNAPGAALQLEGGITIANTITLDVTANNLTLTGINTGGAIQSVSGSNTVTSNITVNAAPNADNTSRNTGFGADAGAALTLAGNINFNHATGGTGRNVIFYIGGAGDVTVGGVLDNVNTTPGASGSVRQVVKT